MFTVTIIIMMMIMITIITIIFTYERKIHKLYDLMRFTNQVFLSFYMSNMLPTYSHVDDEEIRSGVHTFVPVHSADYQSVAE